MIEKRYFAKEEKLRIIKDIPFPARKIMMQAAFCFRWLFSAVLLSIRQPAHLPARSFIKTVFAASPLIMQQLLLPLLMAAMLIIAACGGCSERSNERTGEDGKVSGAYQVDNPPEGTTSDTFPPCSVTGPAEGQALPGRVVAGAGKGPEWPDKIADRQTLAVLEAAGSQVWRTDLNGHIVVRTDGTGYTVDISRDGPPLPALINLNTASLEELQYIIHIGPERAGQIIHLRPF